MLAVELLPAIIYVTLLPKITESSVWLKSRPSLINRRPPAKEEASSFRSIFLCSTSFLDWFMCQKKNLSTLWSITWRQIFLVAIFWVFYNNLVV